MREPHSIPRPAEGQPPIRRGAWRRLRPWHAVVAASVVGALLAVWTATSWAQNRREMLTLLRDAGIDQTHPEALDRVEREGTAHHARLLTSRSLVYDSLARLWQPEAAGNPELRAEMQGRLPEARRLARSALESEPGSWQAAMLVGISTYIERSLAQDRRLYTEAAAWEKPLQRSVERASGHPEPRRLLATAYLETWAGLSDEKKAITRDLLRQVFEDDLRAFEALLPAWLALRLDREETFSVIPDQAAAWQTLERGYAREKRWSNYLAAHRRYLDALELQLEARRLEAEQRLRFGDFFEARSRFLQVIAGAPPSSRFAPLVEKVLATYPPGLHGHRILDPLLAWLDWILELGHVGHELFEPELLRRLIDAVGDLERPTAALANLLARDPYQAERFEKLAQPLSQEAWAPYLVVKARTAVRAGNAQAAREALDQVSFDFQRRPSFLLASLEIARALGDPARTEEAERAVAEASTRSWSAFQWRTRRGRHLLEMLPEAEADAIFLEILRTSPDGAVIDISWNGRSVLMHPVRPREWVRVPVAVDGGELHLVEIRTLVGSVQPGEVRLAR